MDISYLEDISKRAMQYVEAQSPVPISSGISELEPGQKFWVSSIAQNATDEVDIEEEFSKTEASYIPLSVDILGLIKNLGLAYVVRCTYNDMERYVGVEMKTDDFSVLIYIFLEPLIEKEDGTREFGGQWEEDD